MLVPPRPAVSLNPGPVHHQAFVMSHAPTPERVYFDRTLAPLLEEGLFDDSRWTNECRARTRMKVKNRREERHRFRDDEVDPTPAARSPRVSRLQWRL